MVVLVDTNIILDYLTRREPYAKMADKVMEICSEEENEGYIAFHSVSNIWYTLRKLSDEVRRSYLKNICTILTVTGASHKAVINAIESNNFADFEDCLQDECAKAVHADYIITRNLKDFENSDVKAVLPEQLLSIIKELGVVESQGEGA